MTILSVVAARPQLIKAAPVSAARRAGGSLGPGRGAACCARSDSPPSLHYDRDMSQQFCEELEIPEPAYNLGVGSGPHGRQTGQILMAVEEVLQAERPDGLPKTARRRSAFPSPFRMNRLDLSLIR